MFDLFKRTPKAPEAPARAHPVIITGGRDIDPIAAVMSSLRRRNTTHVATEQLPKRGMWVTYNGETYILVNLEPGDVATIHKILPDGSSLQEMRAHGPQAVDFHVPASTLTQAYLEDIPEGRRPDPDHAAKFGYHPRGTV